MFRLRALLFGVLVCGLSATAVAGDITVTARNLNDDPNIPPIQSITVTVLNSAGGALVNQQPFVGDSGTVTFADNQLIAANKTITLIVQSPGREDAVIDVLFGEASQNLAVVLPIKTIHAPPTCCQHRRCRLFRRCR